MTEVIDGEAVAADVRSGVADCVDTLADASVEPGLATVLMSDDPASETYVSMKQRDCEEVGIEGIHVDVDADAPASELFGTIDELNGREDVHGVLVQLPVPDHVDEREVLRRIDPEKDVDGFHPENVGRLVAGDARYKPCTPHGVQKLLDAYDVETEGADAVVVGRSDIVVAAAGIPEFVDGSVLKPGATVIDVGINRVDADTEKGYELVGDVDYDSASDVAGAITPVPGGVGPMTRAMLLYNTVKAAGRRHDVAIDLP